MRNVLHHLAREPHAIGHDGTICLQMKSAPFRRFGDIRCICPVDLVSNLHAPVHQVLGNAETRVAVRLLRPSTEAESTAASALGSLSVLLALSLSESLRNLPCFHPAGKLFLCP